VLRRKAGKSHLLSSKSKKRKRQLRKQGLVKEGYTKMVKRALPYS
ncbi:50S ribosomal protein L35, partial [Candidatus Woesearchaeota archaeon]